MIEITLPWPDRRLSPNARVHWAAKAKVIKAARTLAWIESVADRWTPLGDGPLSVTFRFLPPDRRRRDWDNMLASCKSYADGIAQGLRVNDSRFRPSVEVGDPVRGGAVVITITQEDR